MVGAGGGLILWFLGGGSQAPGSEVVFQQGQTTVTRFVFDSPENALIAGFILFCACLAGLYAVSRDRLKLGIAALVVGLIAIPAGVWASRVVTTSYSVAVDEPVRIQIDEGATEALIKPAPNVTARFPTYLTGEATEVPALTLSGCTFTDTSGSTVNWDLRCSRA